MFCGNCGHKLHNGDLFCPECGTPTELPGADIPFRPMEESQIARRQDKYWEAGQGGYSPQQQTTDNYYCGNCGYKLQDGDLFCPECGTPTGLPGADISFKPMEESQRHVMEEKFSDNGKEGDEDFQQNQHGQQGNYYYENQDNGNETYQLYDQHGNHETDGSQWQEDDELRYSNGFLREDKPRFREKSTKKPMDRSVKMLLGIVVFLGVLLVILIAVVLYAIFGYEKKDSITKDKNDYTVSAQITPQGDAAEKKEEKESEVTPAAPTATVTPKPTTTPIPTATPSPVPTATPVPAPTAIPELERDYVIADSSSRLLSRRDLRDMGLDNRTIRYALNEIYARHGRMFNNAMYQDHFLSKSWYVPFYTAEEFSDNFLSDIEQQNVGVILAYEDELGGMNTYNFTLHGCDITFQYPSEWDVLFSDTGDGVSCYLRSQYNMNQGGRLFTISNSSEFMDNPVRVGRAQGYEFYIGGPTDVQFTDSTKDEYMQAMEKLDLVKLTFVVQ